ncbi:cyclic GMP-AMP synthase-like receptor [Schistocerca serialis cubense]|uniref:cyclic GMP-AMP synthase-like receptor n=1 Tax=Schistocerca serialis cubense TaxID=2023355 RepID=UPI00214EACB1|nr:cyclic GMP-AMP synthase-like receptor [Schistocerca serialis cubense]
MAPYKYKNLEDSIQKILKGTVTLSDEEKKRYNKYLKEIFDVLENEMKKDPAFNALFRQKQYVGSFYENMKIDMPDEFDINFELCLPSYIGFVEVCSSEHPGFCQLRLLENTSSVPDTRKAEAKKQVKKWTDAEGFFSRYKVNQWMQSVVDKALRAYEQNYNQKIYKFNRSTSGPAVTLTVTLIKHPELRLSLDFVPVFVFEYWPTVENLREWTPEMKVEKWYAVPKSISNDKDFRLSFWHQEKYLLLGTDQMKSVLKLIKKLRDDQQWKGFSSYYIKTMFLWKTAANSRYYWRKGLGDTFIEMLNDFKDYLLKQNALPFFWIEENDLLSQLNPYEKQNIGGYLHHMLKDIERNLDKPGHLENYFKLRERVHPFEEDSNDEIIWNESDEEVNWNPAIASRVINQDSSLLTRPQEDNFGTVAAVAVGAAALFAVGLFAHILGDSRRARE